MSCIALLLPEICTFIGSTSIMNNTLRRAELQFHPSNFLFSIRC